MDDRTTRYDRQIRLWGEDGQSSLEKAKICLINATATGSEVLKNLVLPGVGSVAILDSHIVVGSSVLPAFFSPCDAESDLGNNFFLTESSIGKSRASCVTEHIKELNEFVSFHYEEIDVEKKLENDVEFFSSFSLVIAAQLSKTPLLSLSQILWDKKIPLVVVQSCGLVGLIRIAVHEHIVIDAKPDIPPEDLRISEPFPELLAAANDVDLDNLTTQQHGHVPYVLLLVKAVNNWRMNHDGKLPGTSAERKEFKQLIESMRWSIDEENFIEASQFAYKAWQVPIVPSSVRDLLQDDCTAHLTPTSNPFWIIMAGLKSFIEKNGERLPLHGAVPDMTADTEGYIALQKLYKDRVEADVDAMCAHVRTYMEALGRNDIRTEQIRLVCKNADLVSVLRYKPITNDYENPSDLENWLGSADMDDNIYWYILLLASNVFRETYNRCPGTIPDYESDIARLSECVAQILDGRKVPDEYVHEMCRSGGGEVHTSAAAIGGIASQEIIKLIVGQQIPIHSTLIYNGIKATTSVF